PGEYRPGRCRVAAGERLCRHQRTLHRLPGGCRDRQHPVLLPDQGGAPDRGLAEPDRTLRPGAPHQPQQHDRPDLAHRERDRQHLGEPAPPRRHPAGRLRPARAGAQAGEPAGLPPRALRALPGRGRGAARPARAGRAGAPEDRARGDRAADPEHRPRVRPLLRGDARRGVLPAGPDRLARAGRQRGGADMIGTPDLEAIETLWKQGLEEAYTAYRPATTGLDGEDRHRVALAGARIALQSTRPTEFMDLTGRLQRVIEKAGLLNGRVHLQALHTTLGLAMNENEPLLLADLEAMLRRLAPAEATYLHDDFSLR